MSYDLYDYVNSCEVHGLYDDEEIQSCACMNSHYFCIECSDIEENIIKIATEVNKKQIKSYQCKSDQEKVNKLKNQILKMTLNNDKNLAYDILNDTHYFSNIPVEHCPICQSNFSINVLIERNIINYLLYKQNIDLKQLKKDLDKEFGTYEKLIKYLKKHDAIYLL